MNHTPLPWAAVTPCPGECCWHLVEAASVTAETTWEDWVNVPEMSEADAKLIVRCVNAHHTLVAALRKIVALDPQAQRADDLGRATRIAREALQGIAGVPAVSKGLKPTLKPEGFSQSFSEAAGVLGEPNPPDLEASSPNSSAASNGPLRNSETGEGAQQERNK